MTEENREKDITDEILEINGVLAENASNIQVVNMLAHAEATGHQELVRRVASVMALDEKKVPEKDKLIDDLRITIAFFELPEEKQRRIRTCISEAGEVEQLILGVHDIKGTLTSIESEEAERKQEQDKEEYNREINEFRNNQSEQTDTEPS